MMDEAGYAARGAEVLEKSPCIHERPSGAACMAWVQPSGKAVGWRSAEQRRRIRAGVSAPSGSGSSRGLPGGGRKGGALGRSPSARRRRMLPGHPCLTAVPRPGAPIMSDGASPVQDGCAGLSPLFLRDAFPSFPRSGAPEGFLLRSIRSRLRPCATSLSSGPRCHGARPRGLSGYLFHAFP